MIAPGLVLTAAHCFQCRDQFIAAGDCKTKGEFFVPFDYVEFNRYDRSDPNENTVQIILCLDDNKADCDPDEALVVRHPDFDTGTLENDVALIVLPNDLPTTVAEIKPVALNRDPSLPVFNEELEVMGWGHIENGGPESDIPLTTNLRYIPNDDCHGFFLWQARQITDNKLCAFKFGTDVCKGDSGKCTISNLL